MNKYINSSETEIQRPSAMQRSSSSCGRGEEMHLNERIKVFLTIPSQKHYAEHLKTKQKSILTNSQCLGFKCGPFLKIGQYYICTLSVSTTF